MKNNSETTGLQDVLYNLVSTLYHQVHAARTYRKYADDANKLDDPQLGAWFERLSENARNDATQTRVLLKERL